VAITAVSAVNGSSFGGWTLTPLPELDTSRTSNVRIVAPRRTTA